MAGVDFSNAVLNNCCFDDVWFEHCQLAGVQANGVSWAEVASLANADGVAMFDAND